MAWTAILPIGSTKIRDLPGIITGNSLAIQAVLSQTNLVNATPYIPSSHPIFFYANVQPTGWILVTSTADCLLAIKGGTGNYITGGTLAGTWNGPPTALTIAQMPAHTHSITLPVGGVPNNYTTGGGPPTPRATSTAYTTASTGSGATHQHDWGTTMRPRAAVGIICFKDN